MSERLPWPTGDTTNGQEVQLTRALEAIPVTGGGYPVPTADFLWRMAYEGRIFMAADADENDMVTGQTSYAATTPTFLLHVPAGITAIPLYFNLSQSGTVGGGAVDVVIEINTDKSDYASGGTSEKVYNPRKAPKVTNKSSLYSGATAGAGYGIRLWAATIGQDVSPAEGAVQGPFWKPEFPILLEGPASLNVFTYAATTGPTWLWAVGWIEIPTSDLGKYLGLGVA